MTASPTARPAARSHQRLTLAAAYAGSLIGVAMLGGEHVSAMTPFIVLSAAAGLSTPPVGVICPPRRWG
ncbi:MAG: hypothetical protein ACYDH5_13175 [Acidimicrobiales bacterium]